MHTHYTTHALDSLKALMLSDFARQQPLSQQTRHMLVEQLTVAPKFHLPDAGDLLGLQGKPIEFKLQDADILHMPYPCTVLEYSFAEDKQALTANTHVSTKRVTVVFDVPAKDTSNPVLARLTKPVPRFSEQGGLIVMGMYSVEYPGITEVELQWDLSTGVGIIPRDQSGVSLYGGPYFQCGELAVMIEIGLPELFNIYAQKAGRENAWKESSNNVADDVTTALQTAMALSCSNVKVNVPAGQDISKLNKKRLQNGKTPFFIYKELTIDGVSLAPGAPKDGTELAGSRHSPRMHLRRGHIRKLPSGNRTWVNAAIIGAALHGVVVKDYVVQAPPRAP